MEVAAELAILLNIPLAEAEDILHQWATVKQTELLDEKSVDLPKLGRLTFASGQPVFTPSKTLQALLEH